MNEKGVKPTNSNLYEIGITRGNAHWNLPPDELARLAIELGQADVASSGALAVDTGEFKGRSPKDKFTGKDALTSGTVWWNSFNIPFDSTRFESLYKKMTGYFNDKEFYVRDAYGCADPRYRMNLRVITEFPWSNLFAYNMFLRPTPEELQDFSPEW